MSISKILLTLLLYWMKTEVHDEKVFEYDPRQAKG